jgi:hypothetical protein
LNLDGLNWFRRIIVVEDMTVWTTGDESGTRKRQRRQPSIVTRVIDEGEGLRPAEVAVDLAHVGDETATSRLAMAEATAAVLGLRHESWLTAQVHIGYGVEAVGLGRLSMVAAFLRDHAQIELVGFSEVAVNDAKSLLLLEWAMSQ